MSELLGEDLDELQEALEYISLGWSVKENLLKANQHASVLYGSLGGLDLKPVEEKAFKDFIQKTKETKSNIFGKYNKKEIGDVSTLGGEVCGIAKRYQNSIDKSIKPYIGSGVPQEYARYSRDQSQAKDQMLELASTLMEKVTLGRDAKKWFGRVRKAISHYPPTPEITTKLDSLDEDLQRIGDDEPIEDQYKRVLKGRYDDLVELLLES